MAPPGTAASSQPQHLGPAAGPAADHPASVPPGHAPNRSGVRRAAEMAIPGAVVETTAVTDRRPPTPDPESRLPDVPRDRLPRHVAIIMDGNGRWALRNGKARIFGHQAGARAVRAIVTEAARLGLEALTLYSFSMENWKRPADEVDALMGLYVDYLIAEREELQRNNIRFVQCGRREGLPPAVLAELDRTIAATATCNGLTLALALNYGSRAEITDAVRAIAEKVRDGRLDPDSITEETVRSHLYRPELPDPDLLIRTAGEMRVSNYLLWQISYAEFHVTPVLWPDFAVADFHDALRRFADRNRRYGGLDESNS